MRGYEIVTIYLAAGAPFGAAVFLRRGTSSARRLWALVGGTLLWPCVAASMLRRRALVRRVTAQAEEGTTVRQNFQNDEKARRAERELLHRLHSLEDSLAKLSGALDNDWRPKLMAARTAVEKFTGLALAAYGTSDIQPGKRETELCRVAGRTGDDLIIAARCAQRRNRRRFVRRQACARTELLDALAGLKDVFNFSRRPSDARLEQFLSEQLLEIHCRALHLASTLDEQATARRIALLLNEECARLRALESAARSLSHSGMIEAKHLWPLACGVTSLAATLIPGARVL